MACKYCKKKAKRVADRLTGKNKKNTVQEGQLKDIEWLEKTPQGKFMEKVTTLTKTEKMIAYTVFWIPLLVGYFTIVKLIINLFI